MFHFKYNKLTINADGALVFQGNNGTDYVIFLDKFVEKFTKEKDEQIKLLKETLTDKQKIEELSDYKITELKSKLHLLQENKISLEKQIKVLLEDFSKRNISETSALYQEAFNLFITGSLEEALNALDEEKLLEQEAKIQIQQKEQAETRFFKAELLAIKFQYKEAAFNIEKMVNCLSNWETRTKAGNFYSLLGDHEKAKEHYEQTLTLELDDIQKVNTLTNLATAYTVLEYYNDAESTYNEAIRIGKSLAKDDPEVLFSVAILLKSLGTLKKIINENHNAIRLFKDTFDLLNNIDANGKLDGKPILFEYLHLLSGNLVSLADVYTNEDKTEEAKKRYHDALTIYDNLFHIKPEAYSFTGNAKAICLTNLGFLYQIKGETKEAEAKYKDALIIYRKITADNSQLYNSTFAILLSKLGSLYGEIGVKKEHLVLPHEMNENFKESLKFSDESLSILRVLVKSNPKAYSSDLADALSNFIPVYKRINRVLEAEAMLNESIDIIRELFRANPKVHQPRLAHATLSMGMFCYTSLQDKDKSLLFLKESVQNSYSLTKDYPIPRHRINETAWSYILEALRIVRQWKVNSDDFFNDAVKHLKQIKK